MPAATAAGQPRVLSCPNCGGSVAITAVGITVSAICGSCGATLDVANPDVRLIADAASRTRQPAIPIGARGTLAGTEWQVIGYQERSNPAEAEQWQEYLLFNPYAGFRFLIPGDEQWTLYAMLRQEVSVTDGGAELPDGLYIPVRSGRARTDYVMGEFYWRVRVGDEVDLEEFESGQDLLSREADAAEVTWSRGVPLAAATVRGAFRLPGAAIAPTQLDRAAAQRAHTRAVLNVAMALLAVLCVLDVIPFGISRNARLFAQSFSVAAADKARPITTDTFAVPGAGGNLEVQAASPVDNSWVELGITLVEPVANRSFPARMTVEHYDGVDSDGAWSEGARTASVLFASVPAGNYRLVVDCDAKAFAEAGAPPVGFSLAVRRHVPSPYVFYLACTLLVAYPAWRVLLDRSLPRLPKAKA